MKTLHLLSLAAALATWPCAAQAQEGGLVPTQCDVGMERPVYHSTEEITLSFDQAIGVRETEELKAFIYQDGKTVDMADIRAQNYSGNGWEEGLAVMRFANEFLPKGHTYTLKVNPGVIHSLADPDVRNGEISVSFTVPGHLGRHSVGHEVNTEGRQGRATFYFETETEAVGSPVAVLLRDEVEIGSFPVSVTYDWGLGQAMVGFSSDYSFDDGARYTLVLPEGSVSSRYRSDITNEEERVCFGITPTSIGTAASGGVAVRCDEGTIWISGAKAGERITLYGVDGTALGSRTADGQPTGIAAPGAGVFIVSVGGRAYKVAAR